MIKILSNTGHVLGGRSHVGTATIGGSCNVAGAISPNNGLPLTQHAAIRLIDSHFQIPDFDIPELHFLYSWKCNISKGDLTYRYVNGRIELLDFVEGADDFEDFPYDDYPVVFPGISFDLVRVPESDKLLISILNDPEGDSGFKFESDRASVLSVPRHQFGGMPFLLQPNIARKICALCSREMLLTASIGNNCFSNADGFFGNDFVQLLFFTCASCKVVTATNIAG